MSAAMRSSKQWWQRVSERFGGGAVSLGEGCWEGVGARECNCEACVWERGWKSRYTFAPVLQNLLKPVCVYGSMPGSFWQ
jgi:hypothetical protein